MYVRHGFLGPYIDQALTGASCATLYIQEEHGLTTQHLACAPTTPDALIQTAIDAQLTHLWLLPSYGHEKSPEQMREVAGFSYDCYRPHGKDYISTIVGRRLEPFSDDVTIVWVSQTLWGFRDDVEGLIRAFEEIEGQLGIPMHPHPGVMGLNYLRKVDERNYYKYFALPKEADWSLIRSVSVSAISHFKPVTGAALDKKLLICFDRNSSQPYAASQLKAGVGQPVERQNIPFDHLMPGFWQCDIQGDDQLWNGIPLIPTHREWLPTPIVKMAESQGCKIRVYRAYIWPDKKDRAPVFHRWAHSLWALRQNYAPGTPERQAIKAMMNASIGLLRRREGEGHRDYRPDWYSLILAEERAVVWWRAHYVYERTGIQPVGCYHDSLYYAVDNEEELAPLTTHKDGRSLTESLGGYKVDWLLPIEEEVRTLLAAEKPRNAADRIGLLKAWGREHGYI